MEYNWDIGFPPKYGVEEIIAAARCSMIAADWIRTIAKPSVRKWSGVLFFTPAALTLTSNGWIENFLRAILAVDQ